MKNIIRYTLLTSIAGTSLMAHMAWSAESCSAIFGVTTYSQAKAQKTAQSIILDNINMIDSKNQKFITQLWGYFRVKVWTHDQVAIADKIIALSKEKDMAPAKFVELMQALKDLSGPYSKQFIDFEQYSREYSYLLKEQSLQNMAFYGPEHVLLFMITSQSWHTKAAQEIRTIAESKYSLSKNKNDVLKGAHPNVSDAKDIDSIEKQISKDLLAELAWKESDYENILSAAAEFKKSVELYHAGATEKSKAQTQLAVNSIVALSTTNRAMQPISSQDAYTLLSRISGGSLGINRSQSEVLLQAIAFLAKNSAPKRVRQLNEHLSLRLRLESVLANPKQGLFADKAMEILHMSPKEILED